MSVKVVVLGASFSFNPDSSSPNYRGNRLWVQPSRLIWLHDPAARALGPSWTSLLGVLGRAARKFLPSLQLRWGEPLQIRPGAQWAPARTRHNAENDAWLRAWCPAMHLLGTAHEIPPP